MWKQFSPLLLESDVPGLVWLSLNSRKHMYNSSVFKYSSQDMVFPNKAQMGLEMLFVTEYDMKFSVMFSNKCLNHKSAAKWSVLTTAGRSSSLHTRQTKTTPYTWQVIAFMNFMLWYMYHYCELFNQYILWAEGITPAWIYLNLPHSLYNIMNFYIFCKLQSSQTF